MLLRPIAIAAALTTLGAASLHAQTTAPAPAKPAPTVQTEAKGEISADTRKLIGRNIKNMQNETIGEIEAIFLNKDGKVDGVVVGVGGFLGVNTREVLINWKDLKIANNGELVTVNMTKDQLKAMPPYKYRDPAYKGQIFTDAGVYRDGKAPLDRRADADRRPATERMPASNAPTRDFNADGNISADAIVGAPVRNASNDKVGEIVDAYVDPKGQIQQVVVSVGGFLGIGSKHVVVKWSELQPRRDGNSLVVMSTWDKDSLKAMPDYTYDRQQAKTK